MYIKINDMIFNDADWSVDSGIGKLNIISDEPISELEHLLSPENAAEIEWYNDDDELIQKWYNKELFNIGYEKKDNKWYIHIDFKVTVLDTHSEEEIRESVNDTDDAVLELAEYCSKIEEGQDEFKKSIEDQNKDFDEAMTKKVTDLETAFDSHKDRIDNSISNIEKNYGEFKNGIESDNKTTRDEIDRKYVEQKAILDRLDSLYNNLADRVAALENKQ